MTGCADRDSPQVLVAVPAELLSQFFRPSAVERLAASARLTFRDAPDLPVQGCDADVLVTSWGVPALTAAVLDRLPRLRLVAHSGATVKPFVTDEVFARGITVTQAGAAMARPVAEVALTFTLALLHQVHRFDRGMRSGAPWPGAGALEQHEIRGSRVGVVGASRTGRAYIEIIRALGARVSVYDPYLDQASAARLGVELLELDALLATNRIVSLHAPVLPETRRLIGARELALMPDGAGLVNTARAALVDEAALIAELCSGRLSAALDVYDAEPLPADHVLRGLPNVMLTPHRAAATVEGRAQQGEIVVDEILRHFSGATLRHAVTPGDLARMG